MTITPYVYPDLHLAGELSVLRPFVKGVEQVVVTVASGHTTGTQNLVTPCNPAKTLRFWNNSSFNAIDSQDKVQGTVLLNVGGTQFTATVNTAPSSDVKFYVTVVRLHDWAVLALEQGTLSIDNGFFDSFSHDVSFSVTSLEIQDFVVFYAGNTTDSAGDSGRINKAYAAIMTDYSGGDTATLTAHNESSECNMLVGYVAVKFAPGIVKSKQEILAYLTPSDLTSSVTIDSVNMNNTLCILNGFFYDDGFEGHRQAGWLSDETHFSVQRVSSGVTSVMAVTVLELYDRWVRKSQRGQTQFGGTDQATWNIDIQDTNPAGFPVANYLGTYTSDTFTLYGATVNAVKMVDHDTVQILRGVGTEFGTHSTESWEVINLR